MTFAVHRNCNALTHQRAKPLPSSGINDPMTQLLTQQAVHTLRADFASHVRCVIRHKQDESHLVVFKWAVWCSTSIGERRVYIIVSAGVTGCDRVRRASSLLRVKQSKPKCQGQKFGAVFGLRALRRTRKMPKTLYLSLITAKAAQMVTYP